MRGLEDVKGLTALLEGLSVGLARGSQGITRYFGLRGPTADEVLAENTSLARHLRFSESHRLLPKPRNCLMKMFRTTSFALFILGLVAVPPTQAQTPWEIGPYLGVDLDRDELIAGATARFHLSSIPITLNPGIEFYPSHETGGGADASLFVLNFDVQYQLNAQTVEPYVGGGISWARQSVSGTADSDVGLNLKGGTVFNPSGSVQPYVEAVLNFASGDEALILKGGFLFSVGR